jgi:thiamine kinase-like enzyme
MSEEERHKLRDFVYAPAVEAAIEKFAPHFDDKTREICRKVGEQYVELFNQLSPNYTFVHGDFRQDNFIYKKDNKEAVVMDWQISGAGHGIFDVTYFVCQSLPTDLRRRIEKPLVETYVESLKLHGVDSYGVDTAWHDYRLLCLFCLIYPITVCGTLDLANERGKALGESMLTRNLAVIEDLDCAEFLG